ncbi:MAG: OsmC family protein [Candidatus Odinarchaeia archaeon]
MKNKLEYEINVEWDGQTGATVSFKNMPDLKIDMASDFGGGGKYYCSDEIFLTSVAGCILETFLYIGKKMRINLKEYIVHTRAIVEGGISGYYISKIIFDFKITVAKGEVDKAKQCFDLSVDYCHLRRALNPKIELVFNKTIAEN